MPCNGTSDQDKYEKVTRVPVSVGTVWKMSGQFRGQVITASAEVTRYEPYSQYGFKLTSGPIQASQTVALLHAMGNISGAILPYWASDTGRLVNLGILVTAATVIIMIWGHRKLVRQKSLPS